MNAEALIRLVRVDAKDLADPPRMLDEQILEWLAEAEEEACVRKQLLFESELAAMCEIALEEGRRSYPIDARWVTITRAWLTQEGSDDVIFLNIVSREALDQIRPAWRTEAREPCEIMVYDTRVEIGAPISKAWALHLEGQRLPLEPLGGDAFDDLEAEPEIAAVHHRYLRHWALHRSYSQPDTEQYDPDKAARSLAEFVAYFGTRPDADQRRDWYADTPHHSAAHW